MKNAHTLWISSYFTKSIGCPFQHFCYNLLVFFTNHFYYLLLCLWDDVGVKRVCKNYLTVHIVPWKFYTIEFWAIVLVCKPISTWLTAFLLCQYWILSIMPQALSIGKELFEVQRSDFTTKEKTSAYQTPDWHPICMISSA